MYSKAIVSKVVSKWLHCQFKAREIITKRKDEHIKSDQNRKAAQSSAIIRERVV